MKKIIFLGLGALLTFGSCLKDDPSCGAPSVVHVETVDALQQALNSGATGVVLDEPLTQDATVTLPAAASADAALAIGIPAGGNSVTVVQPAGVQGFATIDLVVEEAEDVVINTPNSSVSFAGDADNLTATTAATTLTIEKGSTVGTLTVHKGSVKIYGTVAGVPVNSGTGKIYYALGSNSDRPAATDIIKTYAALSHAADGVILTPGNYDHTRNGVFTQSLVIGGSDVANAVYSWYLPIEKPGFEIIGDGDRDQIVIYSTQVVAVSNISTQDMITVTAANVKIAGVTVMPKEAANKAIAVHASGLTLDDCVITPNTKVGAGDRSGNGGDVTFSPNSTSGTVTNCLFKAANIKFNSLMSGTYTVSGNTFDGAYNSPAYGPYSSIATRNYYSTAGISSSTLAVTGTNNTFTGIAAFGSVTPGYAMLDIGYGTFTLASTTLPGAGTYYNVTGGTLVLNGQTHTAP